MPPVKILEYDFLRRHYPHQVKGSKLITSSQPAHTSSPVSQSIARMQLPVNSFFDSRVQKTKEPLYSVLLSPKYNSSGTSRPGRSCTRSIRSLSSTAYQPEILFFRKFTVSPDHERSNPGNRVQSSCFFCMTKQKQ